MNGRWKKTNYSHWMGTPSLDWVFHHKPTITSSNTDQEEKQYTSFMHKIYTWMNEWPRRERKKTLHYSHSGHSWVINTTPRRRLKGCFCQSSRNPWVLCSYHQGNQLHRSTNGKLQDKHIRHTHKNQLCCSLITFCAPITTIPGLLMVPTPVPMIGHQTLGKMITSCTE